MKVLSFELKDLKQKYPHVYNKLYASCYRKGFMKHLLHIAKEEKSSQAHVLYDDENNICSWMTTTNFPHHEVLCMFWTPIRKRKKGYAKILLHKVKEKLHNKKFSAYLPARKLMCNVFGTSNQYKNIYQSYYLPNRLKHCAGMREYSLEPKFEIPK